MLPFKAKPMFCTNASLFEKISTYKYPKKDFKIKTLLNILT